MTTLYPNIEKYIARHRGTLGMALSDTVSFPEGKRAYRVTMSADFFGEPAKLATLSFHSFDDGLMQLEMLLGNEGWMRKSKANFDAAAKKRRQAAKA